MADIGEGAALSKGTLPRPVAPTPDINAADYPVAFADLRPDFQKSISERLKEKGANANDITIVVEYNWEVKSVSYSITTKPDGALLIAVPFAAHVKTEEWVRSQQASDEQIKNDPDLKYSNPALETEVARMSAQLGIHPPPILLKADLKGPGAFISREGTRYITVDEDASLEAQIAVSAHELGHHKNGDTHPAKLVAGLNDVSGAVALSDERAADSVAAQLCKSGDSARNFEQQVRDNGDKGKNKNIRVDFSGGGEHPSHEERISFFRQQEAIAEANGSCKLPNQKSPQKTSELDGMIEGTELPGLQKLSNPIHVAENSPPNAPNAGSPARQVT